MDTTTVQVSFTTDNQGFMSQECPGCRERFKIRPARVTPGPVAHCPFCGHAGRDCWFTPQQAEYLEAYLANKVLGPELEKLNRAFDAFGSGSGGMITVTGTLEMPSVPPRPPEVDDDLPAETTFACCGETVRHDVESAALYCVICGQKRSASGGPL